MISIKMFDEIDQVYDTWYFKINKDSFIDVIIDNRLTDTIKDYGRVSSLLELKEVVDDLSNNRKVESTDLYLPMYVQYKCNHNNKKEC